LLPQRLLGVSQRRTRARIIILVVTGRGERLVIVITGLYVELVGAAVAGSRCAVE
jgi:hypothetical protein